LENKKKYFLNIEGNMENLEFLSEDLSNHILLLKNKNYENLHKLLNNIWVDLLLGFYYTKNSILVNNEDEKVISYLEIFEKILEDLFNEIQNLNELELNNSGKAKFLNLLLKVIFCGWNTICYDLKTQIKWFYKTYYYSKTLEEKQRYVNLDNEIAIKQNLEQAIFFFDANLFENNNQKINENSILASPLKILISLISPDKPNNLLFNFDRINSYKIYELIHIKDELLKETQIIYPDNKQEKEIKEKNSYKYICRPYVSAINPKSNTYPFYMLLCSLFINLKINKESLVEDVIKSSIENIDKNKLKENSLINTNFETDIIKEININRITNSYDYDNSFGNSNAKSKNIYFDKDVNNRVLKVDEIKKEFEKESIFVKIILKYFRMRKNFCNFKINKSITVTKEEEKKLKEYLEYESHKFWSFLEEEILENNLEKKDSLNNSNTIVDFTANSIFNCIGDINEFISMMNSISNNKLFLEYENLLFNKSRELIEKNLSLLKNVIYSRNTLQNLFFRKNTFDKNFIFMDKLDNTVNIPSFKYLSFSLYLFISKLSIFISEHVNRNNIESIFSLFNRVIDAVANINIDYNTYRNDLQVNVNDILYYITPNSFDGKNRQLERQFEYLLGNEIIQINETVKIPENNLIIVEIDFTLVKDKPFNYDLVIVSEDHSYNNLRLNTNNNLNNFGTCFNLKLANSFSKTLFLIGKEIKIFSPIDFEFGKNGIPNMRSSYGFGKTKANFSATPKSQRSILKIKSYPYKYSEYGLIKKNRILLYNSSIENNQEDIKNDLLKYNKIKEFVGNDEANRFSLFYILDYLKTIDYACFKIIRSLINAVSNRELNEKTNIIYSAPINNITSALINNANLNLVKNVNQELINENNKKILSEFLLKNGLKINILNNIEDRNYEFNLKDVFIYEVNRPMNASMSRKSYFTPNSATADNIDLYNFLPNINLKKTFNDSSNTKELENHLVESNPKEVLDLLFKKLNFYSLTQNYLEEKTEEVDKNSKNNQRSLIEYLNKFDTEKNILQEEIIKIIKLINKTFQNTNNDNKLINLAKIEDEINEGLKFSSELKSKIRCVVTEPNNYRSIKFFSSFTKELKIVWNLVEHLIILIIITYLTLQEDIFNVKPNEFKIESLQEIKKETLFFIGNKLNLIVNWMSAKVQQKKDTFDSLKNYIEFIIDLKENDYKQRKEKLIEEILKYQNDEIQRIAIIENIKIEAEKAQITEVKKEQKTKTKKTNKNLNGHTELIEKTVNFKKKQNAKRLYQDLSKNNTNKKTTANKKETNKTKIEKEISKNTEKNSETTKSSFIKDEMFTHEKLNEMDLISLINKFSIRFPNLFFIGEEDLKKIQEEINLKIESDIKEAYLGNSQKLKSIMEVNELLFDENNLNDSILIYIKFVKNKLTFYLDCANLNSINSLYKEINKKAIIEVLCYESPFYQMAYKILEKLLFIFEINSNYDLNLYDNYFNKKNSNINPIDYQDSFSAAVANINHISDEVDNINLDMKKNNSIKFNSNKNLTDFQDILIGNSNQIHYQYPQSLQITIAQHKTLDSIFNLIYGKFDINQIRDLMLEQNRKLYIRQLGLTSLNYLLESNFMILIKSFQTLPGILSSSIKKNLEDDLETALCLRKFKNYPLMNLLIHLINSYNELIEMVNSNETKYEKISSFNYTYGLSDLSKIDKHSIKKISEVNKLIKQEENKSFEITESNPDLSNKLIDKDLKNISAKETSFHLEMINLILSDLIILFKRLNETSELFNNSNINLNNYKESFESFISKSLKLVYNNQYLNNLTCDKNSKLVTNFKENLMIVLSKLVSVKFNNENNQQIYLLREILLANLFKRLEDLCTIANLQEETISVLEILFNLSSYLNLKSEKELSESNSLKKGFEILFRIIISSDIYQIINLCCNIFKILVKKFIYEKSENTNYTTAKDNNNNISFIREIIKKFYFVVFEKLGNIFIFKNQLSNLSNISNNISALHTDKSETNSNSNNYYVLIHMNSHEIDYQFLVNALYYWEEKYPTKLSLYKYKDNFLEFLNDKNKEKEILDKLNINKQFLNANNNIGNTGQKTKMFNYFNPLKAKNSKISYLEKIVDERITNIKKAIEEGNKFFNSKKEKEETSGNNSTNNSNVSSSPLSSGLDSIKERIFKLKQQEAYQNRIKAHIKLAELIGETASIRGYVCIEPYLSKEKAEELAEILQKAYNHLLPHFKANVEEKINLFPDELIYPKMPDKDLLLPGCTNILKETTISFMNVTIIKRDIYEKIENCQKGFFETIKKSAQAKADDRRIKAGLYSNNIFVLTNAFLNTINYNDNNKNDQVLNNECTFGATNSMIIQELVNLFYEINNTNTKNSSSLNNSIAEKMNLHLHHTANTNNHSNSNNNTEKENFVSDFITIFSENFKKLSLDIWKNRLENLEKIKILGMLIICCDYYGIIRENTNTIFNNDTDKVCKVLSGGHKSGKNKSYVLFTNEENISIDKIDIENLQKQKSNLHLINKIPLFDLFEGVIKAYEIYRDNRDSLINKMLFQLILKLLQDVKIDNNHDLIFKVFSSEEKDENRIKLLKLIEILRSISNEIVWLEKEDLFWEKEFIDAFERIYDRIDKNSDLIFSPVFHFTGDNLNNENPIEYKKIDCSDLITKFNLPDSNYKKYLPKINDMSKFQTALKNIVNFDRYIVGEIFNYCKSQYRDDEYLNYLYQIRYHLSNGDTTSAKSDIYTIFDNNKMPQGIPLPRETYDNKEITKEDCFPGNYYLAKIPNSLIKETKIKGLKTKGNLGINEVPVLLLLIDNSINQALVLYNDINYSQTTTFWINIDNLTFLDSQIKIPANSFKMSELLKEYNYLEKRLRILFSKKILLKLMKIFAMEKKFNNFEETLLYLHLNDWNNFKLNPISGVFRKFKNYIRIKKNKNASISTKENILAEKSLENVESENENEKAKFNLNEIIYSCSEINLHKNKFENSIAHSKKNFKAYNIENLLSELKINEKPVNELIIQWSMNNWDNLDNHFLKIKTDLFAEFNTRYDGKLRTKEMFHIGNFNKKMLALHELFRFDISNFAGIILSFEQEAILGPHAKISFYSDPYGENLVDEIYSIKTTKSNLETVVFNYPKIWMNYTPGTRAFYIFEWYTLNRDSYLPCSIVFVPHIWTKIVSLTDYSTASLLSDLNVNLDNFEILSKFIRKLLNHCTSMSLPAELQRRVFNITNRTILKASKLLSLLEQQKKVNFKQFSISKKFSILGIDEFTLMRLIDIISKFNEEQKDKNFSSAYIVEGVEIILSILAVIKEPFNILDKYLRETFNYILPVRIEAIIKLGQFLNFFQGTASLEGVLMKEIYDQLKIDNQYNNIIFIDNLEKVFTNDLILEEIKVILSASKAKIVDFDKDVKIFESELGKYVFILIDGFIIENLAEKVEEIKEPEPVDDLWECFHCHMENDKDNTFCIFCDKNKKTKPKEKPPKQSTLIKTISFDYTLQDLMNKLVTQLKKLPLKINEKIKNENKEATDISTENLKKTSSEINIVYSNSELWKKEKYISKLNKFLEIRIISYLKDYDYISQKIRIINNYPSIKNSLKSHINYLSEIAELIKIHIREYSEKAKKKICEKDNQSNLIDLISEVEEDENILLLEKIRSVKNPSNDFILFFEAMQNNGVDLWFENSILDSHSRNSEIDIKILEKLREFIDIRICKEKGFSLNLQAICLRFVPSHFNSINCYPAENLETYSKDFRNLNISHIRFYWTIIKYFNNCLCAALPIIKPPDTYLSENVLIENDDDYLNLPFPKTMSAFLSSARGIAFSITKQNLIRDIITYTEFSEEQVQIPTFKFERLNIKNNLDNINNKKGGNALARKSFQNFNLNFNAFSNIIGSNSSHLNSAGNNLAIRNNISNNADNNILGSVQSDMISENMNLQKQNIEDLSAEESLFIQAYEQAKDIDPAFFRSKKMPGDPHVGFKVDFKGELVVGIGGPYRQFFSDISSELQDLDKKHKKLLKLLHPTSNNISGKGEFKDKFCITPCYNSNTALLYYKFLGLLMGFCIRTGVHLTLDLCSLTWKKIVINLLFIFINSSYNF